MTWPGNWSGDWPGSWQGAEGEGGPVYADAAAVLTGGGSLVASLEGVIRLPIAPGFFNEASGLPGGPAKPTKRKRLRTPAAPVQVYADASAVLVGRSVVFAAIESTRRALPPALTRSAPALERSARTPRVPVIRSTPALVRSSELELA